MTNDLVILAYWGKRHDSVTQALAKKIVITEANAWYRRASYGRQGIKGTATPWVHIATQFCGDFYGGVFPAAEAAALRRGYNWHKYQRVVVYEPCLDGDIGLGAEPGNKVLLFSGGMNLPTAVHEQGHNYGLDHANLEVCTRDGHAVTFTSASRCSYSEYSDYSSAMALEWNPKVAGDFTAPQKYQLGWLAGHTRTVRGKGSVLLAPYETTAGTKAIRVPGTSHRTYWVEDRTARGNDVGLPASYRGVLIHLSTPDTAAAYGREPHDSLLLDMLPGTPVSSIYTGMSGASAADHVTLPPNSSWTSPEGIRFSVGAQTGKGVKITIARKQHTKAPKAVRSLKAVAGDGYATVTFHAAADNGDLVHYYRVTTSPASTVRTVRNYQGATTIRVKVTGLRNHTAYRFFVSAVNEAGAGRRARSASVVPLPALPSVAIKSPQPNSDVSGMVTILASATPNAVTKQAIQEIDVYVDGTDLGGSYESRQADVVWDTALVGNGRTGKHTIKVVATDVAGRATSRTITVDVVRTSAPTVVITAPTAHATVTGVVAVRGTVTRNAPDAIEGVVLEADGDYVGEVDEPGSAWTIPWDTTGLTPGAHTLMVTATDAAGRTGTSTLVAVTVAHPAPTVTITSPASGATVSGSSVVMHMTVTNPDAVSHLGVTVHIVDSANDDVFDDYQDVFDPASSSSLTATQGWDTTQWPPGSYSISVTATDDSSVAGTATEHVTLG